MEIGFSKIRCETIMRKSRDIFIAMTGAQGVGKSTLAEAMKKELDVVLGKNVVIVQGVARQLKDKGFSIDKDATVSSKWAIEGAYVDVEQKLRHQPKIFCRSVIDRFAYARAGGLDMEMHFHRILPSYCHGNASESAEYDLLIYIPIEKQVPLVGDGVRNPDVDFQVRVDTEIRKLLYEYRVPVQVVQGTVEQRLALAVDATKLRIGHRVREL